MNEKISVIIPTYKRYDVLERAIKSVLNQTYKNLEIIVIDDNAEFPEIRKQTEKILRKYPNIIYIQNEKNLGGGPTRNVGIKKATSKYIAFLDDDDEFLPTKIEKQYKLYKKMNNNNVGMIYCYVDNYMEDGTFVSTNKKDFEGNVLFEHLCYFTATTSCWLCPKKVLLDVGMFDDIPSQQDATLILKMLGLGYEIYRVPEVLLNWYIHNKSGGITKVNDQYIDNIKRYQELGKTFFHLLTKKQSRKVEYLFHNKLFHLQLENKNRVEAKNEIKRMIKINPFGLRVFYNVIKYIKK